jgi:hypothetical protein
LDLVGKGLVDEARAALQATGQSKLSKAKAAGAAARVFITGVERREGSGWRGWRS